MNIEEHMIWLLPAGYFLAGCIVGALLAALLSPAQKNKRKLEAEAEQKEQEQKAYQEEVAQHFNKSAELLAQMADSYKAVHQHLSSSAHTLCPESFKPSSNLAMTDQSADGLSQLEQPLDYAPREENNPDGVLNEAYGLDKQGEQEEQPNITTPAEAAKHADPKMLKA